MSTTALALAISPDHVSGENLLTFLSTATSLELEVASTNWDWADSMASLSGEQISTWWAGLKGNGPDGGGGLDAASGYSALLSFRVRRLMQRGLPVCCRRGSA